MGDGQEQRRQRLLALNVDDAYTWACYHSDFSVARIRDDIATGWHNDITGATALAVAGPGSRWPAATASIMTGSA